MELIDIITKVNYGIAVLFFICYFYQFLYLAVPLFKRKEAEQDAPPHRYAFLIAARNESAVIGHLIDSIWAQEYPRDMLTVFVVADNCTDDTAQVARAHGAVVYERSNLTQVGKGYAIEYLVHCIGREYDPFDGYFIFDADNLLEPDYVAQMNRVFSQGNSIVTSYRNSKNYGDNWISAGYALWFLRESAFLNRPRYLLNTSCAVSGTGFLFSHEVLNACGGWPFHLLTEDIEFTIHNVTAGRRIAYCGEARYYDEQPTKFKQSWRQRMRWAKGYLQVFQKYGTRLLAGIPRKGGFACFDMCMTIMPAFFLTAISIVANIAVLILTFLGQHDFFAALFSCAQAIFNTYLLLFVVGAITTVTQWNSIDATTFKKILYTFTFPIFMLTYIPISFAALFRKVEWKHIDHTVSVSLGDMKKAKRTQSRT